ncbi:hypothetical protein HanRHA438_Chr06g0261911 [Helianthus annuus]|nr:hypothetical protein HanIR_Chr06g0272161 [Helianthus annuus]KAJ0911317.1 hypothetical protein HanRHA438_Chr06g0261911 [Helianthus annuus]
MSSSQMSTARVEIHARGRNRALRLDDGCRMTVIGAWPGDEVERLCERCVRVVDGVLGFPHSRTTAATDGEDE